MILRSSPAGNASGQCPDKKSFHRKGRYFLRGEAWRSVLLGDAPRWIANTTGSELGTGGFQSLQIMLSLHATV
jgi:hypothetical protein